MPEECGNCEGEAEIVVVSGGVTVQNGEYVACPDCGMFEKVA